MKKIANAFYLLIGPPNRFSLEHRLFNAISFANGVFNLFGLLFVIHLANFFTIFVIYFTSGIFYLLLWYLARFRIDYTHIYWPFLILTLVYLSINWITNAGSNGGAHYYMISAPLFAIILARKAVTYGLAFILFFICTTLLFYVEYHYPDLVSMYSTREEQYIDVFFNFVFEQIFVGFLVLLLSRNLNQERERSDRLLQNILPASIAEKLRHNQETHPGYYEKATVLFTDFKDFTQIAEKMTPEELVQELDFHFSFFDQVMEKYKIEKIKTIGDSYMAVGGIPSPGKTHALDCVLAGLEIVNFMKEQQKIREEEGRPVWKIRIGVHTGPLIAGVIGKNKFAYDVWGDTVNMASRMESSGEPGYVNISSTTYKIIKRYIQADYRGQVEAKNKGAVEMYFVTSLNEEVAQPGNSLLPSDHFLSLLNKQRYNLQSLHESVTESQAKK